MFWLMTRHSIDVESVEFCSPFIKRDSFRSLARWGRSKSRSKSGCGKDSLAPVSFERQL